MGDLVRPADRRRYPRADDVSIFVVRERYRLRDFDQRDVFQEHYFTFVAKDGSWKLASDADLEDVGLLGQRNVWDFGPIRTDESEHFVVVGTACRAGTACPDAAVTSLLAAAEAALREVDKVWTRSWNRRVPILVPRTSEDLSRIIQATYSVDSFLAFAFWTGGGASSPGARILVNPERFSSASTRATQILTHELTHIAMLPRAGLFTPRFLDEGVAEYVRTGGGGSEIAAAHGVARVDPSIPEDWRFLIGDSASIFRIYQRSLSLIDHIVARWGWDRLERLYVRLGSVAEEPGMARFHLDRATRRTLGVSTEELLRGWASSIGAR
jgi:hypothetical protein